MEQEETKWTGNQVIEAFSSFQNPDSGVDSEQATEILKNSLAEIGEGPFGPDDIFTVTTKITALHCAGQLAGLVVRDLVRNHSPASC